MGLSAGQTWRVGRCLAPYRGLYSFLPALIVFLLHPPVAGAQILNLPARPPNAPAGSEFVARIKSLSLAEREEAIYSEITKGNVPEWMRKLSAITNAATIGETHHTATYFVTPDYLSVGSPTDYFLCPMTPRLAQRLAEALQCSLPTRKMVNEIWTAAPCRLVPTPIPPGPAMTTVEVFAEHNGTVLAQRLGQTNDFPLGTLTAGSKKDVVLSVRIYTNFARATVTRPVVIYGWHQPGGKPIQPVYNGHGDAYADYSHGIRLVQMKLTLDGSPNTVTNVLMHPALAAVLSDENVYDGNVLPRPFYPLK